MTDLQAEIWQFLLERFIRVENAKPSGTILVRFNPIRKKEISDREFRETVSQPVTTRRRSVRTPTRGYNMAQTMSEKSADLVAYEVFKLITNQAQLFQRQNSGLLQPEGIARK
jgi:hypothetical protein